MKKFISIIGIIAIFTINCFAGTKSKKLIQSGWCAPDTEFLLKNYKTMEANSPYDGVGLILKAVDEKGKVHSHRRFFFPKPLKREWFKSEIKNLNDCKFTKFTDNFVKISLLNYTKWQADWYNDAEWEIITKNMGHVAWAAKQGGCKGFIFDPEAYQMTTFKYDPACGKSFKETYAKARERGRQFMRAVTKEFPDISILGYWTFALNEPIIMKCSNPRATLKYYKYGLYPAFLNGIMDAMPPGSRLYDGCEQAYENDSREKFLEQFFLTRHQVLQFVEPENINKFHTQTETAFNIFLDAYLNPERKRWYIARVGETRLESMRRNLTLAYQFSGKYLWTWGETCRWWDIKYKSPFKRKASMSRIGKMRLWTDVMPDIMETFERARYPYEIPQKILADIKAGTAKNLVKNPGFDKKNEWIYSGKKQKNNDAFSIVSGAGINNGKAACLDSPGSIKIYQYVKIKPGVPYAIQAFCRLEGAAFPKVVVCWANASKKRMFYASDRLVSFSGNSKWLTAQSRIFPPTGAEYMLLTLHVKKLKKETGKCFFDNIIVTPAGKALGPNNVVYPNKSGSDKKTVINKKFNLTNCLKNADFNKYEKTKKRLLNWENSPVGSGKLASDPENPDNSILELSSPLKGKQAVWIGRLNNYKQGQKYKVSATVKAPAGQKYRIYIERNKPEFKGFGRTVKGNGKWQMLAFEFSYDTPGSNPYFVFYTKGTGKCYADDFKVVAAE